MKANIYNKLNKRIISLITVLVLVFNILPQFSFFDNDLNDITASAASSLDVNLIKTRFGHKMDSLGWVNSVDMKITNVNSAMWQSTSGISTYWIDTDKVTPAQAASSTSIGKCINMSNQSLDEVTKEGGRVSSYSYTGYTETKTQSAEKSNRNIKIGSKVVGTSYYYTYLYEYLPNDTKDGAADLYYTIEKDEALNGYYRQYYVSTADQLATLFYYYQKNFSSSLKATAAEAGNTSIANKVAIVLLCDLDLGGSDNRYWIGYLNLSVNLEFDGRGHSIYNGYLYHSMLTTDYTRFELDEGYDENSGNITYPSNVYTEYGRFLRDDQKIAIHDVTFSNMFIGQSGGMFGSAKYSYFNNVNWNKCLASGMNGAENRTTIVFNNGYNYCHLKDCTIDNCYITGNSHSALFASYDNGTAFSESRSYIGDDTLTDYIGQNDVRTNASDKQIKGFYYTSAPDDTEDAERAWNGLGKTEDDGNTYWLTTFYPSIFENCATVNSEVYDIGSQHSGTFVSCIQSNIIFKNCFSNCTIFAFQQEGVFLGAVIGSSDGFYYPYNGKKTLVNSLFENCYTSGSIEGSAKIGGFVGMIFDDSRAYDIKASTPATHKRGIAVFKNCYSTSSVGMQYSGSNVGGFVGIIRGNIQGGSDTDDSNVKQHIFENCYAAGEVGGITTSTSTTGNTNSIGGFVGSYANYDSSAYGVTPTDSFLTPVSKVNNTAVMINSYYDKQTTAMRERDIGYYNSTKQGDLVGTFSGLTGVYTKSSKVKRTMGLTDTVNMKDDVWDNSMSDYYPQLKTLTSYPGDNPPSDLVEKMKYERQLKYYNYSLASTATVLLDHYDSELDEFGNLVFADPFVYDTVRDITSKFEFTTDYDNSVAWADNIEKNEESGFSDKIGSDGNGFTVSYENSEGNTLTKAHNPDVMKIVQDNTDEDKYKCSEFAPGKQWVKVTTGSGNQMGERNLRLLPTAYLNAGGIMEVNVVPDDNDASKVLRNEVKLDGNLLSGFNHYAGVAYALTDTTRMGDDTIYNGQEVSKYSSDDTSSFVLYGGYLLTGDSTAVGLKSSDEMYDQMYDQKFAVTNQDNNSSNGMTMIKIFSTKKRNVSESEFVLDEGNEITDSSELEKWSGNADFTSDDVGYYYMVYYWRLTDGRYLTDKKLVKIKSESHTFEIITGIINQEHSVWDTPSSDGFKAPIDQYVTDVITEGDDGDTWDKNYPSKDTDFNAGNAGSYYDDYNKTAVYGDNTYYIKNNKMISTSANSVMGWHRTTDYRLTTLIVEVQTPDGTWVEMARIDSNSPTFDFSNAKYQYHFSGYTVDQNSETKLFTVTETSSAEQSFEVKNGSSASGIENFIEFNFENSGNTDNITYDSSDSIRVTALFRQNSADIQMEKFVLKDSDDDSQTNASDNPVSLQEQDEAYEVDNTGITDNTERKAVLSGDTLTYRMKLYNAGYFDSENVNVYDKVPDGCEYVDGSMRIYKQKKDLTSGTVVYDEYKDVTDSENYSAVYNDGNLHWKIPTIELYYDYYVEYKVKVNQLSAAEQSRLLTNTAQWDFIMLNGDLNLNNPVDDNNTSIENFKQNAIFDMNVKSSDDDVSSSSEHEVTYEITFMQQDKTTEYQNINFENELPDGFTYKDGSNIELVKVEDGTETKITDAVIVKNTDMNTFSISGFSLKQGDRYMVRFTGKLPELTADNQIVNKASLIYDKVDNSGNKQTMGNSISKTTRLSNQVETDVEHLYFKVEKTIENSDPSQTFLFKIERFASEEAKANGAEAKETYYAQIHCTEEQNDGTYKGSQLIQVDKRGYYTVTEVTDWSATDYDFKSTSFTDVGTTGYPEAVQKNGEISQSNQTVEFSLPRLMYSSGAFPSSMGIDKFPIVGFTNETSDYAYLSGQAYAENTIKPDAA